MLRNYAIAKGGVRNDKLMAEQNCTNDTNLKCTLFLLEGHNNCTLLDSGQTTQRAETPENLTTGGHMQRAKEHRQEKGKTTTQTARLLLTHCNRNGARLPRGSGKTSRVSCTCANFNANKIAILNAAARRNIACQAGRRNEHHTSQP